MRDARRERERRARHGVDVDGQLGVEHRRRRRAPPSAGSAASIGPAGCAGTTSLVPSRRVGGGGGGGGRFSSRSSPSQAASTSSSKERSLVSCIILSKLELGSFGFYFCAASAVRGDACGRAQPTGPKPGWAVFAQWTTATLGVGQRAQQW